jgi:hypothetical protein
LPVYGDARSRSEEENGGKRYCKAHELPL